MMNKNVSFAEINSGKLFNAHNIDRFEKINTSIFDGNKLKVSVLKQMKGTIKNLTDPVLKSKLSRTLLTTEVTEIREILSPVMIMSLICGGRECVDKILFPLLYEYYNRIEITSNEKTEMTKILRECYNKCKEMCLNDFDLQRQATSKSGIDEFYINISNIIKPYKLF